MSEQERPDQEVYDDDYGTDSSEPMPERSARGPLQNWLVRLTLGLVALVILVALVGGLVFSNQRSSRNQPLNPKVYPGATLEISETLNDGFGNHDRRIYTVVAPLLDVEQFYDKQKDSDCVAYTGTLTFDNAPDLAVEGHAAMRCTFDRSGWGITQYSTVLIQAIYNDQQQPTGQIAIVVDRYWGD
jgi:hypothetical protein